jgi:hypothetical protein
VWERFYNLPAVGDAHSISEMGHNPKGFSTPLTSAFAGCGHTIAWALGGFGRVEDGRGSLGHAATLRFPSPLIEPDVPISGIRLSDWFHRKAHGENSSRKRLLCGGFLSFALRYSFL